MKKIENMLDYVRAGIEGGSLVPEEAVKVASIRAEQGVPGQTVVTITKSGDGKEFLETVNEVKVDSVTGNPGWIVTNPGGERYIVDDSVFCEKYYQSDDVLGTDVYHSKAAPALVVRIGEDISFVAPWGEDMNIQAGGFLVLAGKDNIYGIQKDKFFETYRFTGALAADALARAEAALGIPHSLNAVIEAAVQESGTLHSGSGGKGDVDLLMM